MPRKLVCALGVFDGVHLGHAKILLRALKESEKINGNAAAVTFHMHPKNVVSPGYVPEALTSAEEKRDLMRGLGIRNIYTIEFTKAFSMLEPEAFARKILAKKLRPAAVVAGTNFRFGRRRAGNMAALNALGAELGFRVISVPLFRLGGKNVSSTGIRNLIRKGRVVEAAKMLGRHYSLAGTVARGNGIGRKLGFPTANLKIQDKAVPSTGVYAVKAGISGGIYDAVCNIGVNPTFNRLNKNFRGITRGETIHHRASIKRDGMEALCGSADVNAGGDHGLESRRMIVNASSWIIEAFRPKALRVPAQSE